MSAWLIVVPAAPVLLPGIAVTTPSELEPVLAACDEALQAVLSADEIVIEAAHDHLRDRTPGGASTTGWAVADHLLDRVGYRGVRVRIHPGDPRPGEARLYVADGSASVGPKAPRPNPEGQVWDAELAAALATGDSGALRGLDDGNAAAVGCTTASVWRSLGTVLGPDWSGQSLTSWAPFGVTYWVAVWEQISGRPGIPDAR